MICPTCRGDNDPLATACLACGSPLDTTAALRPGALFASRYEILGILGRGGMGMVYKARDCDLREVVALKVLRPDVAMQSTEAERRFRSEIRLARKVRHPNVCPIYGDGEYRGLLFIAMELVEGTNLAALVRRSGGLPRAEAYDACLQIAEGLRAIHEVGIIHRDLKPANIMLDQRGLIRLMDFGIAKRHADTTEGITETASGRLIGTPEYMSPEQIRGGTPIDYRTDLYSFGVVVYETFTGRVPFHGDTPVQTLVKHLQDPPPLHGPAAALLPPALISVLAKMLAKSPSERFRSAEEAMEALRSGRDATPGVRALTRASSAALAALSSSDTLSRAATPTVLADAGSASYLADPQAASQPRRVSLVLSSALGLVAAGAAVATLYSTRTGPTAGVASRTPSPAPDRASVPSITVSSSPSAPAGEPTVMTRSARLTIAIEHNVKQGTLNVVVDQKRLLSKPLAASKTRKALIFRGRKSELFEVIDVAPGERTIRIEVEDGEQKKAGQISGGFKRGETRLLEVKIGPRVELTWR